MGRRESYIIRGATTLPTVKTRVATLDTPAYVDRLSDKGFVGIIRMLRRLILVNILLDVVKIDAESTDLQVVAGASQLLLARRIGLIMWEMPNNYPLRFKAMNNLLVSNFQETFYILNHRAGLTCHLPGKGNTAFKLTGCLPSITS